MSKDHRYPEEVRIDACRRVTLARHPELKRLVVDYGLFAVIGAAVTLSDRQPTIEARRDASA